MLNDARARNDVLSQAYLSLQAEYVKAKSTSSPSVPDMHHTHPKLAHSFTSCGQNQFPGVHGVSMPTNLGSHFVDPAGMADMNATDDLEAFLYSNSDMRSYTI